MQMEKGDKGKHDDPDGCEWVNVSSRTGTYPGSSGQTAVKWVVVVVAVVGIVLCSSLSCDNFMMHTQHDSALRVKKKQDTKLLAITSLIIIRFSNFFH